MHIQDRTNYVKSVAAEVGFDKCGIAGAGPIGRADYLKEWLDRGYAGSMTYLHRYFRQRADPRKLLPGAESIVVVALSYKQQRPPRPPDDVPRGQIAMYAWGSDYHKVIKDKLFAMHKRMEDELEEPFKAKVCVDTAPLLEREIAAAAGIGWIGKNTLVLDRKLGSYFFLGALVTTLELIPDEPLPDHCGTCTACLTACPTDAFPAPYRMDASRCISYLTIEHHGGIPAEFQTRMGDWIFGCDICQEVCPHNRHAPQTGEPLFSPRSPAPYPKLDDLLSLTIDDYKKQLRGSAMTRASLEMLKRNARVARNNATCTSAKR